MVLPGIGRTVGRVTECSPIRAGYLSAYALATPEIKHNRTPSWSRWREATSGRTLPMALCVAHHLWPYAYHAVYGPTRSTRPMVLRGCAGAAMDWY
eukprot:922167-Rhodomonas_salina.4